MTVVPAGMDSTSAAYWYAGPATWSCRCSGMPGTFILDAFDYTGALQRVALENLVAGQTLTIPVLVPARILRGSIVNNGGANGAFSMHVTPDAFRT
ncbi:MAG: hypothetical protein ACRDV9_07030 [Acidimicrobiia bacterium]